MDRAFRVLASGTRAATAACLGLCVALFGGALLVLSAEVVLRYAFNHPLQNVSEGVIIAFIWVYSMGGAALYARNDDITLDFFFRRCGARPQAAWLLVVYLAIVATMAVVLVETVKLILVQRGVLTPSLRLPLGIEHAALVVAAAVIAYASAVEALGCWIWLRTERRPRVFDAPDQGVIAH